MKVVTVRQPFASLIAVGAKTLLDQARPTGYRGRLLIRAGQELPEIGMKLGEWEVEGTVDGGAVLVRHRLEGDDVYGLPLGMVVASCELVDCVPIIDDVTGPRCIEPHYSVGQGTAGVLFPAMPDIGWYADEDAPVDYSDQLPFGDFAPGRWVWLLDDVRPTTERCPRCWGEGLARSGRPWPGHCQQCGARLKRPDDTSCNACGSSDYDEGPPTPYPCPICRGEKVYPPVRMRGGPGLRTPEWEDI